MIQRVDDFLNGITMYRLVLYGLCGLSGTAVLLSWFGLLPFSPIDLLMSAIVLLGICWIVNAIFARVFVVPPNVESVYITGLILLLIISPAKSLDDFIFLGWAATLAMATKYSLAIYKKHIFNPAAIAVVLTAFVINRSATWWIGTPTLLPFVILVGVLIVRKVRKFTMVFTFLVVAIMTCLTLSFVGDNSPFTTLSKVLLETPLFFFSTIMLTEPLTMPPRSSLQLMYATIVGFLFAPQVHLGSFYTTPELALIIGNVYAYLMSPKYKLVLKLKEKIMLTPDIYDFVFSVDRKFPFRPGQYFEWTLGHKSADNRGNRRYFTIASSPAEADIRVGVRFSEPSSSFKKALLAMQPGSTILAGQLAGDFVLPNDPTIPCVLIAGGIGITPFRSMIQYLLDTKQRRPITLLYSTRTGDFVYQNIFDRAGQELNIATYYRQTQGSPTLPNVTMGRIDETFVREKIPNFSACHYYLSGPWSMVTGFSQTLAALGIHQRQIITDYFPGFA